MGESLCERCGKAGTVTVGFVGSHRAGSRRPQPGAPHHYCVDCARAEGVRIPPRKREAHDGIEPGVLSWTDVEQHLATYEQILHEQPSMREHVSMLARRLRKYSDQIPGAMPSAVVELFTRLGASEPE